MKENLTPNTRINYAINRMPEAHDTPTGGSAPTGASGGPPEGAEGGRETQGARPPVTPERIEAARRAWEPIIRETTNPSERETMRVLAEMGRPPVAGGAPDINLDGITDLEVRLLGNGANDFLSAAGETLEALFEVRSNIFAATVPPGEEAQKRLLLTRVNERIRQRRQQDEEQRRHERQEERRERRGHAPEGLTMEDVNKLIDEAPDVGGSRFPPDVMEAAFRFKETRERLINRILFKPFEDTTDANRYDINLYAQDNLEQLLGFLSREDRTKYDYFVKLQTAARLFHTMNSTMVGGKLEEFIREAANINYEHFSLMQQIKGVPDVMRLYEEKYQEILAKNKRIATEGYIKLREEVEKSFIALNEGGIVRSEYEEERAGDTPEKMQEWEVSRALNAGRTFFNITFRAAEHIANGQLEEGGRKWTGFPQEDAVRLMNWSKWLVERFGVAEPRGGLDFLHRTNRNYFEFLDSKRRKLGINRIAELGGMKVDELELGAMFGVSGVYSSWRNETMLFPRIKVGREENSPTLEKWLGDKVGYIWGGKIVMVKEKKEGKWVETDKSLQKRSAWIEQIREDIKSQDQLLEFLTPVVENVDTGLGVLLRQGILSEEVGYKARERIWQRVAETNLPLMVNYLSSISLMRDPINFTDDNPLKDVPAAGNRIRPAAWTLGEEGSPEREEGDRKWAEFEKRILLDHAWKMKRAANLALPAKQRTILSDQSPIVLSDPENYTRAEEEALTTRVRSEGRALAGDFADILFPYTPFMNDVPFELIDYSGPGETFYKRRSGSDLPSFSAANRAFTTIVNNPGGIGAEEALKQFDAIVKGIEQPQGTKDAQERVFPMFSAWGEFVMARPGQRQMILKAVTEMLRKPTSIAQEFAGMDAESLDENQMVAVLGHATKAGILSHDLYNEMKKKKHLGLFWILWALFRDILVMAPAIATWEMGKETMKKAA